MIKSLNGPLFVSLLRSGAANLEQNKRVVNDLNVFPVPDGDTGDNMSMTINSAAYDKSLDEPLSLEKSSEIIARDMLLGARGNSGVILSRIFKGISLGFSGLVEANVSEIDSALKSAVNEAYASVTKPVEGTILTVLKDSVRFASDSMDENTDLETYFENLNTEMKNSLDRTPDLLPSLKEAGVVDSGGVGLAYIFDGFEIALSGDPVSAKHSPSTEKSDLDISLFTENSVLEYGYCTEFLLRLQTSKTSLDNFDLDELKSYLNSVGDSVVIFREDSIIKAHVHTKTPGKVLTHCQQFGEFLKLKIENMTLQHNGASMKPNFAPKALKPKKKYAIVVVASGDGVKSTFSDLGVDYIIDGGQTMNPSTRDFVDAFGTLDADHILVYPNNKNIKMSAAQAADLYEKSDVIVIPTRTIGEAYMAISELDLSSDDPEKIVSHQISIIDSVTTAFVSKASRTITMNGVEVVGGDYIGYVDDNILVDDPDREDALLSLSDSIKLSSHDLAILIYGSSVDSSTAEKLKTSLEKSAPMTEIILINGGQSVHDYILILS